MAKAFGIALLLLYALFPFYWMLTTAVDTHANSRGAGILPSGFTLDHFKTVLIDANFFEYIKVSLIVAAGTVLLSGAIALFAAIGVARYRFRLRTVVLVLVLMVQMVPLEALVIPLFLQARTLNMLNSLLGLVIVYLAFSLPFAIWNLKGFVAAVPKELEEAAYIDGAGWFRMFFSILLPLVAPGLVATSVFAFITAWNEFIFALTFMTDSSKYTVGVGLRTFFTQNTADWGPIMAASTIIALPVVIFFVLVQRQLSSGLTAGAVKG
ncbi:carbohydrate ABC transporter permease [Dermabacter hominis]|nr:MULTISPECIES: carbohydrate ABC transporter permease [Dermabacter]MCT1867338.1 carbohydrate ABC transporter permease [Dermabacter sp. p3-SID358]MCT1955305.1 carbohydrate ABC transporter permease [Dermabacter hominis]MCT2024494.1 carbohydrate ABC transporter permease [Dermabacter hominis]MDU1464026.1 carbohydrate ABC transporter permease [Dermabacter sp.]MDU4692504.1 carbohydrate ABC transporter permease [Dermabacter sp.]